MSAAVSLAGTRLARYELLERVGSGGMGEVYRAVDTAGGGVVALKILPPAFAEIPQRLARFRKEAEIASSLSHPNIARVIEIGQSNELHFIAMEFVEGEDLADWCSRSRHDLASVLRLLQQVGDALARAHAAGVLHRDLKPANVRVTPAGQAKLLDFGLAKAAGESSIAAEPEADTQGLTGAGQVFGTMAYMSPEQARGRTLDRRSDIFSFGILLYEAVAGVHPFPGAGGLEAATGVLRDDPIPALGRRPGTPRELVRLLAKALQKEPTRRYQFMDDLLVDLSEVRHGLEQGTLDRHAAVGRRARWWRTLAASAVIGLLLGAGAGMWAGRMAPPRAHPLAVARSGTRLRPLTYGGAFSSAPAISPDGARVAYACDRYGSFDIMVLDLGTGRTSRVTDAPGDELRPVFSPDAQTIAFATAEGRIRTVPALGGTSRTIAEGGAEDPTWSPDGSRVAYRRGRRLFVVSLTGGDELAVTGPQDLPVLQRATWSPDGQWLVFPSVERGRYVLARAPTRGGAVQAIGDETQALGMPAWAGSLPWIVGEIAPPRDYSPEIWAMPLEGSLARPGPPVRLLGGVVQHRKPVVSRDGQRLVFEALHTAQFVGRLPIPQGGAGLVAPARLQADARLYGATAHADAPFLVVSSDRGGLMRLWRLPREGGAVEPFREGPGADEHPALSPDGRRIAFSHIEEGRRRIAVMSASGGELTYLSEPEFAAFEPAWSANGGEIAFAVSGVEWSIRVSSVGGGPSRLVASGKGRVRRPTWSPDGQWIAAAVRAPDGRSRLVVLPSAGGASREVLEDAAGPLWLPQGQMVYARQGARGDFDLWGVPVSPHGVPTGPEAPITRLPRSLTVESDSGIATDGRFLYFTLTERLSSEIWLAEAAEAAPAARANPGD